MKRLMIVTGLILVVCLLVPVACAKQSSTEEPRPPAPPPPIEPVAPGPLSTQGYVYDDKFGYGFDYPGGWELCIEEGDFPRGIKKVVSFVKEIPRGEVICRVLIVLTVKSATNLQEVKNELKKEIETSETPILDEATILVSNMSGYDILSGSPTWKQRHVVFFANGMAYIFRYASAEEYYHIYEETFNNVLDSFVIQ